MNNTVLLIATSAQGQKATSFQLAQELIEKLSPTDVITRDLSAGIPVVSTEWVEANLTPAEQRTDTHRAALALSDSLISEIQAADTLVITCPIYNFGLSSALKAWVDQICRAGITFQYTENGPVGLLEGKRAYIVITSGGVPVGSAVDFASPHLQQILKFIGISDIKIIAADQQMTTQDAIERASAQIRDMVEA